MYLRHYSLSHSQWELMQLKVLYQRKPRCIMKFSCDLNRLRFLSHRLVKFKFGQFTPRKPASERIFTRSSLNSNFHFLRILGSLRAYKCQTTREPILNVNVNFLIDCSARRRVCSRPRNSVVYEITEERRSLQ